MLQQAQKLKQELLATPELQNLMGLVDVKLEADGLNIEIMDTEKTSMFQSGSAQILPDAEEAFSKIGPLIAKFPNTVDIVGHTDAKPFGKRPGAYSNWDLSADRANAARKLLERNGVPLERIASVSGRADKELKFKNDPLAAANRRITLKVRLLASATPPPAPPATTPARSNAPVIKQPENTLPTPQEGKADSNTRRERSSASEQSAAIGEDEGAPKPEERTEAQKIADELRRYKEPERVGSKPVPTDNGAPLGKDKIFGDNPVVGPSNLFANP
jgi:chemotaxis protein MotB